MSLSLDTPLSLYSIPFVYATAFYPHNAKFRLINKTAGFNNVKPRGHDQETLSKKGVPQHIIDRIDRMTAAHQNGMEVFPVWATAVLAANYAGIDQSTLNIVSGAFIAFRLLFNSLYINQTTKTTANFRTLTWATSMILPFYLFIKAGNRIRLGL